MVHPKKVKWNYDGDDVMMMRPFKTRRIVRPVGTCGLHIKHLVRKLGSYRKQTYKRYQRQSKDDAPMRTLTVYNHFVGFTRCTSVTCMAASASPSLFLSSATGRERSAAFRWIRRMPPKDRIIITVRPWPEATSRKVIGNFEVLNGYKLPMHIKKLLCIVDGAGPL
jgi:hypothetical protein